jgi:hypothetical protein
MWREEPRMSEARSGHVAVGTEEGRVVVAGGCMDGCGERTASVEVLDCGSGGGWTSGSPMLMERFAFGGALLPNY